MEDKEIKQPEAKIQGVGQQLTYPLDFVTQEIIKNVLPQAWPIGSIFTSVVSTNPSLLLGYGVWESFGAGKVLVGLDSGQTEFDTIEETGGAKTHTLTTNEIPAHNHLLRVGNTGSGPDSLAVAGKRTDFSETTTYMDETGGGAAHNNLQPYIVVYFFKRTS